MTNTVRTNPGRQEKILAEIELDVTNLNASGEVTLFKIPAGAVVVEGGVNVSVAFDAGTSLTLDVGISGGDTDLWSTTPIALQTIGTNYLTFTTDQAHTPMTAETEVAGTLVLTSTAPAAGNCNIWIEYYMTGREAFSHCDVIETP